LVRSVSATGVFDMPPHLVVLNIGNTHTQMAVVAGRGLTGLRRVRTASLVTDPWLQQAAAGDAGARFFAASVVPAAADVLVARLGRERVTFLEVGMIQGLDFSKVEASTIGADRLANAVGGKLKKGTPLIIIDFGTAITLDLVDQDGAYAGGCILPGLETSADALNRRTAQLPHITLRRPAGILGRTTKASMQSGLHYGIIGAVDSLIERLWGEIGYKTGLIVTGGGAASLAGDMAHPCEYDPHLTLRGLKAVWELNQIVREET